MSFLDLTKRRQSCRSYIEGKPVEREKLIACLEAARLAPSACNSQPWKYIAVTAPDAVKEMVSCVYDGIIPVNRFARQVPAFVVVTEEKATLVDVLKGRMPNQKFAQMDIGLSVANFCLAATDQELGTCIMGWFKEDKVKKLLDIPESVTVRLILAVGYPKNPEPREKSRKAFEETVSFDRY